MSNITLIEAERNLEWAAGGEFSARVTPTQAQALLDELVRLRKLTTSPRLYVSPDGSPPPPDAIGAPPDFGRASA